MSPGSFGNSLGSEWKWALGIPLGIPLGPESLRLCSIEPPEAVVIDVGLAELFPPSEVGKSTAPKVMGLMCRGCNQQLGLIRAYIYIYMYMYVCICIHTHTYIYIYGSVGCGNFNGESDDQASNL